MNRSRSLIALLAATVVTGTIGVGATLSLEASRTG